MIRKGIQGRVVEAGTSVVIIIGSWIHSIVY